MGLVLPVLRLRTQVLLLPHFVPILRLLYLRNNCLPFLNYLWLHLNKIQKGDTRT